LQKVFLGEPTAAGHFKDLNAREWIVMAAFTVSIIVLGLYPQPVLQTVKGVIQQLVMK